MGMDQNVELRRMNPLQCLANVSIGAQVYFLIGSIENEQPFALSTILKLPDRGSEFGGSSHCYVVMIVMAVCHSNAAYQKDMSE